MQCTSDGSFLARYRLYIDIGSSSFRGKIQDSGSKRVQFLNSASGVTPMSSTGLEPGAPFYRTSLKNTFG